LRKRRAVVIDIKGYRHIHLGHRNTQRKASSVLKRKRGTRRKREKNLLWRDHQLERVCTVGILINKSMNKRYEYLLYRETRQSERDVVVS